MKNMEMTVEEDILTIEVDLRKEFGPPSSGVSAHNPITVGRGGGIPDCIPEARFEMPVTDVRQVVDGIMVVLAQREGSVHLGRGVPIRGNLRVPGGRRRRHVPAAGVDGDGTTVTEDSFDGCGPSSMAGSTVSGYASPGISVLPATRPSAWTHLKSFPTSATAVF